MNEKKTRLDESDITFIKNSKLKIETIASIIGCSVSAVEYYRNRGIWSKKKKRTNIMKR